jgi:hypothetical protein
MDPNDPMAMIYGRVSQGIFTGLDRLSALKRTCKSLPAQYEASRALVGSPLEPIDAVRLINITDIDLLQALDTRGGHRNPHEREAVSDFGRQ